MFSRDMRPFSLALSSYGGQGQQRVLLDGDEAAAAAAAAAVGGGGEEAVASSSGGLIEKEHMFDKVVTPSDVGKLNRLVIPKQHAEKYFPLDSSSNEKGLLLNFEDRNGKPWRFRYSYWNSSQSYVMTKGWSRFVKEKKLDAGDIVSFQRGSAESAKDRLFIDWRRRPDSHHHADHHHHQYQYHNRLHNNLYAPIPGISLPHHVSFNRSLLHYPPPPPPYNYNYAFGHHHNSMICNGAAAAASGSAVVVNGNPCTLRPMSGAAVFESVPVVQGKAAAKRLRLFGVNMECAISDECDISAASATTSLPNSATLLQLRPYGGGGGYEDDTGELLEADKPSNKSSSSSMSLDLDI